MTDMNAEKKRVEAYMLVAARKAGVPIPSGETPDEEPDFRFKDEIPALGIELSEVLRPASSNHGILPVEQESFHKEIITKAQQDYYDGPDANPAHVNVYFTNTRGGKRSKGELARTLTEFVRANVHRANPFVGLYRPETPDGFDSIVISAESRVWWCGEGGGYTLDDIRPQLAARISSKDKLVPTYRANLPAGARVWLLLYSGVTVARSMMIPHGIEEWKFSFRFDRVFWFGEITRWEDRNLPQAAPRFNKGGNVHHATFSKPGSSETRSLHVYASADGANSFLLETSAGERVIADNVEISRRFMSFEINYRAAGFNRSGSGTGGSPHQLFIW